MARPPMKPDEKTVAQVTARVTQDELEELKALERELGEQRAAIIRRAISELYKRVFKSRRRSERP